MVANTSCYSPVSNHADGAPASTSPAMHVLQNGWFRWQHLHMQLIIAHTSVQSHACRQLCSVGIDGHLLQNVKSSVMVSPSPQGNMLSGLNALQAIFFQGQVTVDDCCQHHSLRSACLMSVPIPSLVTAACCSNLLVIAVISSGHSPPEDIRPRVNALETRTFHHFVLAAGAGSQGCLTVPMQGALVWRCQLPHGCPTRLQTAWDLGGSIPIGTLSSTGQLQTWTVWTDEEGGGAAATLEPVSDPVEVSLWQPSRCRYQSQSCLPPLQGLDPLEVVAWQLSRCHYQNLHCGS